MPFLCARKKNLKKPKQMKIKLFALSAVATLLFACGGGSKPEDVAKAFHEAITSQDYAAAS
jgi:hypothetical protein